MYFSILPKTLYTLDDKKSLQVVTNILLRAVITEEARTRYSLYDEYDVPDGDTPEITAFKVYGDSTLHWVILHYNEILDPRFMWIMDTVRLKQYVIDKYGSTDSIHHFEDSNGNIVNGNVIINYNTATNYQVGDAIINETYKGSGFIVSKPSNSSIIVNVSTGSFQTGNQFRKASNTYSTSTVSSSTILGGTPVTNFQYEDLLNEQRRRIKVLKPRFVQKIVSDFQSKLSGIV